MMMSNTTIKNCILALISSYYYCDAKKKSYRKFVHCHFPHFPTTYVSFHHSFPFKVLFEGKKESFRLNRF